MALRKLFLILSLFWTTASIGQSPMFKLIAKQATVAYDADAENWFTRVEGHGVTIPVATKGFFNTLYVQLKANSLYTIPYDMYFFGWANAAANAEPMKNVAPDITWNGTVTHASTGIAGNGTTGYGNLGFAPNALTLNNSHISVYSRTATSAAIIDIGARGATATVRFDALLSSGNNLIGEINSNTVGAGQVSGSAATATGMSIITRVTSTDLRAIKNGTQVGVTSTTTNNGTMPSVNMFICAVNNNGSPLAYTAREYIMASVGTGFSTAQAATYTTLWNTTMTSLGLNTF